MLHGSSNNCSSNKIYQIYSYYNWAFILRLVDAYSNIHIQCFATLIAPFIYPTDFFSLASRNIHCISIFALLQMYHYLKVLCYNSVLIRQIVYTQYYQFLAIKKILWNDYNTYVDNLSSHKQKLRIMLGHDYFCNYARKQVLS